MAMTPASDPSTPSPAARALDNTWKLIRTILRGAEAVKEGGVTYLPQFGAEDADDYQRRKRSTPWRPEFEDEIRSITSKPFSKEVRLAEGASKEVLNLSMDVDGRGNNQHVFAKTCFEAGVSLGAVGILVDYPVAPVNSTVADERAANIRPFWVKIEADEIIALRSERRGGRDIYTHLRIKENTTVIDGFKEEIEERIRVIEPGRYEIFKKLLDDKGVAEWVSVETGVITLDEVPFTFIAMGEISAGHYVKPPMLDLANMQIELYQALSDKREAYVMAGSPMLSANGMGPPGDGAVAVLTGPRRVLYAPGEGTSWSYLHPAAANLKELRDDVASIQQDMQRLGLQPLLPHTGNVTATASGIEGAKAHTAVQTWANALKDGLERAWDFTNQWRKATGEKVEVIIHTDFAAGVFGAQEVTSLIEMRKSGLITQETFWNEMVRRGFLGPEFDPTEEAAALLLEAPADEEIEEEPDDQPGPRLVA